MEYDGVMGVTVLLWMEYDGGDSFALNRIWWSDGGDSFALNGIWWSDGGDSLAFDYELNGVPFGSKSTKAVTTIIFNSKWNKWKSIFLTYCCSND